MTQNSWIDINVELPNYVKNREVVVFMPRAYSKISVQTVYNYHNTGSCFSKGWNKGEGVFEVTHWMPLPGEPT